MGRVKKMGRLIKITCDICGKKINKNIEFTAKSDGKEEFTIKNFDVVGYVRVPSVSEPYQWIHLEDVCGNCIRKIINNEVIKL